MKTDWKINRIGYVIVATLIATPFVYIVFVSTDKAFWDNTMGNMLATMLALVAGIPTALFIDGLIKSGEKTNKYKSDRIKEKEILTLILEELNLAYSLFKSDSNGKTGTVRTFPWSVDYWNTLCSSGLTHYIEEPLLLDKIVSAYFFLTQYNELEKIIYLKTLEATATRTNADGTTTSTVTLALGFLRGNDGVLIANVDIALATIAKRIEELTEYEK